MRREGKEEEKDSGEKKGRGEMRRKREGYGRWGEEENEGENGRWERNEEGRWEE